MLVTLAYVAFVVALLMLATLYVRRRVDAWMVKRARWRKKIQDQGLHGLLREDWDEWLDS